MNTFELLHEKVKLYIFKQKWESFRVIQDQAIQYLLKEDGNLLICAPTASGKTEAAFLPIVSSIADDYSGGFHAVYISPLKALINDQFRRIDELCNELKIPVTKWHGDVAQGVKTKALKKPEGILLITPESLEAMLINKPQLVRSAFKTTKFFVIDEIHSFVGSERGAQLYSIIKRIEFEAQTKSRVIALSATVGNPGEVAGWFSPDNNFNIIEDKDWADSNGLEGKIRGFLHSVPESEEEVVFDRSIAEALISGFSNGNNLIFGNSKRKLEEIGHQVISLTHERRSNSEFLIHHGSLSKETREHAEHEIKHSTRPVSIFCTSTLEMGIDIGAIEKIGLIDPPWSVSSFAQRVGRSGRRKGSNRKFEFLISQNRINEKTTLGELCREDLVKAIAIVLLYLKEFKEPLRFDKVHYSTLVHQVLAFSLQRGGAKLSELDSVIRKDSFRGKVSESDFRMLLEELCSSGLLFQNELGLVLPGKVAEKITEHYEFYSVFSTSEQWTIVFDTQVIGQIPVNGIYREGDHLLLSGRVWMVVEVNDKAKRISVRPAKKANAPAFSASFGITHRELHQKMLEVYESDGKYVFLDGASLELLGEGRSSYKALLHENSRSSRKLKIFEGTLVQNTIMICLKLMKIQCGVTECFLEISEDSKDWYQKLKEILYASNDPLQILVQIKRDEKVTEKYDHFLPTGFLNKSYAESYFDLPGAIAWFEQIK